MVLQYLVHRGIDLSLDLQAQVGVDGTVGVVLDGRIVRSCGERAERRRGRGRGRGMQAARRTGRSCGQDLARIGSIEGLFTVSICSYTAL